MNVPINTPRPSRRLGVARLALLLAPLLLVMGSCGAETPSLTVQICGDVRVPQDVDAVRIAALNSDRVPAASGVLSLLECEPAETVVGLPQTMDLNPGPGDSWITLEGIKEGVVVAHYEQRIKLEEGDSATLTMGLTRDCLGILSCALGQSCVDGQCVIVEYGSPTGICAGGEVEGAEPDDPGPYCDDEGPVGEGEGEGDAGQQAEPDAG